MTHTQSKPAQPDLVTVHRLNDGSVLYKYADGSWVIDVPALGRHQLVAGEAGL